MITIDAQGRPRSVVFDDIYFAKEDGAAEVQYLSVEGNDLPERFLKNTGVFCVGELGFGTGLSFAVTLHQWHVAQDQGAVGHLEYQSLEGYPLTKVQMRQVLSSWTYLHREVQALLQVYPEEPKEGLYRLQVTPTVTLVLVFADVSLALPQFSQGVDAWYLDGFGPKKNPQMWAPSVFQHVYEKSNAAATLTTFTAAGHVRRGLQEVGFSMEKRKGFGPKWECLFGKKL